MNLEHKHVSFEIKEEDGSGGFTGYASVFGNVDGGGDVVEETAFDEALKPGARRPKMLWQHNPASVIGVWDSFTKDSKGLIGKGRILKDVRLGAEALSLMKAGAIDGLSIGYKVKDDEFLNTERGMVRRIKSAELWEVSVVTFPMNELATVTDVKNLQSARDVEAILREAGVPNAFAKLVALCGFEEATHRLTKDRRDGDEDEARAKLRELEKSLKALKGVFHAQG